MTIQQQFVLRYRATGHVRFQVPESVCRATIAKLLEQELAALEGVTRVTLFTKLHKLSIRYDESIISLTFLAKQLFNFLEIIEKKGLLEDNSVPILPFRVRWRHKLNHKFTSAKATRWLKSKYTDAQETVQAAKIVTKLGLKKPRAFIKNPEQAIIDFLNEVLVLYLLKTHWRRVTQEWIPNPFKYRYEWLVLSYLFFLLIRSRRSK